MDATNEQKPVEFRMISTKLADGGKWVAVMGDEVALGAKNITIESLQSAARVNKFNALSFRGGIHVMDAEKLGIELAKAREHGMTAAADHLERARDVINKKNGDVVVKVDAAPLDKKAKAFRS